MSTPSLPLLTAANWYLWEQQALNFMTIFGHAGHSIQTNNPFMLNGPCKPLRMFYLEEMLDPATQEVVVQQSSRPRKDRRLVFVQEPKKITILLFCNIDNIDKHCGHSY